MTKFEIESRISYLTNVSVPYYEKEIKFAEESDSKFKKSIVEQMTKYKERDLHEIDKLYKELDNFIFDAMSLHDQEELMIREEQRKNGLIKL